LSAWDLTPRILLFSRISHLTGKLAWGMPPVRAEYTRIVRYVFKDRAKEAPVCPDISLISSSA